MILNSRIQKIINRFQEENKQQKLISKLDIELKECTYEVLHKASVPIVMGSLKANKFKIKINFGVFWSTIGCIIDIMELETQMHLLETFFYTVIHVFYHNIISYHPKTSYIERPLHKSTQIIPIL